MSENKQGIQSSETVLIKHTETRELLCALVDGELDQDDVARVVSDCDIKDWASYQLIGDIMRRSDAIAPVSGTFAARMSAALEREPVHRPADSADHCKTTDSVPFAEPTGWRRWLAWPTVAVSAAVASVVWVAQPLFQDEPAQVALTAPVTVPVGNESMLSDYTEAHRQWAGPISIQQASFMPGSGQ